MTAFPARGQKAPDYWDVQLQNYIDEHDLLKADQSDLDLTNAALGGKASQTYVDAALGDKADADDVVASLATKADLVAGKVPAAQLPSYVDDVLEYANLAAFPVTGASGILYVALDTSKVYRWSGSVYAVISDTLVLGSTSTTAMRGDQGTTAYTHSQIVTGNPHNTTATDVGAEPTLSVPSQAEAEAGTATTGRKFTAQRVFQAIAAYIAANVSSIKTTLGISPVSYMWSSVGSATIATTGAHRVAVAQTLAQARMRVVGAPSGSALTIELQRQVNGAGAWTTLVTSSIVSGSTTEDVDSVTTTLAVNDLLRLNITSVGSTTAATGVVYEAVPA